MFLDILILQYPKSTFAHKDKKFHSTYINFLQKSEFSANKKLHFFIIIKNLARTVPSRRAPAHFATCPNCSELDELDLQQALTSSILS